MCAPVHESPCVVARNIIGYLGRVMGHDNQLVAVALFPEVGLHSVLPEYVAQVPGDVSARIVFFSYRCHNSE